MTRPFRLAPLLTNRVSDIRALWPSIDLQPIYQRQSDIWQTTKRQLFIDSLVNGYDIPKLYFHDLSWNATGPNKRYAIIDGKQRLEAIHAFVEGAFSLSDEFEDIEEEDPQLASRAAGLSYTQLSATHPDVKARFDGAQLPIVLIQTRGVSEQDLEVVEEMFSRLNEAVPLNAPEKRNALGGPLPPRIRALANDRFFTSRLGFPNYRYRHLDLATKFLYMEYREGIADLKKRDLDTFVRDFKERRLTAKSTQLARTCAALTAKMCDVFVPSDPLLISVGMVTIYYQLFRDALANGWLQKIQRAKLVEFDDARAQNRSRVKEAEEMARENKRSAGASEINPVLSQFERYVQSPNDSTALTSRFEVLRQFVRKGTMPSTN